jgi:hypothetical protein
MAEQPIKVVIRKDGNIARAVATPESHKWDMTTLATGRQADDEQWECRLCRAMMQKEHVLRVAAAHFIEHQLRVHADGMKLMRKGSPSGPVYA